MFFGAQGRTYPVEVFYAEKPAPDYLQATVKTVLDIHTTQSEGDILAFLTGQDEVHARARARVSTIVRLISRHGCAFVLGRSEGAGVRAASRYARVLNHPV